MNNTIICTVSNTFDIILESQVASTGFGWCLKSIPEGVELASIHKVSMDQHISPGCKERNIFTFVAVKPLKGGTITFDLLRLTHPECQIADTATYIVEVHDKDENDELKKEIGETRFVKGTGAMLHARPITPYGFADAEKIHLMYGFPPSLLYGYPVPNLDPSVIESKTNCNVKYGNPFGIAVEDSECYLKYGFPVIKYGYPPIYKYGFPISSSAGKNLSVKEDAQNCIVKYGTPFGVAGKPEDCTLKYGFPVQD